MDAKSVEEFQEQIGIKFHEPSRLWNAFIHSSYANERRMSKDKNNERLEFLGDAVLELVTSNYLYRTYQKESEGKLSKIRASLVCEPTLAGCARDINLGKYVLLSKGEDMTGGRSRDSILSDAFEAVIGAIYLDQGIETATKFIETYLFKDVETSYDYEFATMDSNPSLQTEVYCDATQCVYEKGQRCYADRIEISNVDETTVKDYKKSQKPSVTECKTFEPRD